MSLRKATFTATRWTTAATMFRAVLQVLQTMVLARLLAPHDFGLMAMAGVVTAVAALFTDLGLGSALMHFPRPDARTLSTIYWMNLGMSLCLAALFVSLAWPVALAYRQPQLLPVLCWLSLSFPLGALGQPFRVMAEKELRFPQVARQEIAASILGFLVAIAVAIAGGGVFALVAAMLTVAAANSALAWLYLSDGMRPARQFSLGKAEPFLRFGLHRVGGDLWNTLCIQCDVLIAGLYATAAGTGFYSIAREQCLRVSNTFVNPVVVRVGLPVMARLQNDEIALRSVYLQTLRMTASLNFPVYALFALFPGQIVGLLLGDQWSDAAFYLRLFALWGLIRSTGNPSGSLTYAVGLARRVHLWNLAQLVISVPLLWLAAEAGGLPALAGAMCVLQLLVFVLVWRVLIRPACGATFIQYGASLLPPLLGALIASVASLAVSRQLPYAWQFAVGAIVLGAVYFLCSLWLNRSWLDALKEFAEPLWKPALRRK